MCSVNRKDVAEINAAFIKGIRFHYVDTMQQVLDLALTPMAKPKSPAKKAVRKK